MALALRDRDCKRMGGFQGRTGDQNFLGLVAGCLGGSPGTSNRASSPAATVAEIRVDGLCNMLPEPEGSETRAAFFAHLNRLYALVPTEPE
jgi:hypothetical protein